MRLESVAKSSAAVVPVPWRVQSVRPLTGYRLRVHFVDGAEGVFNLRDMIFGPHAGVFAALRDEWQFADVYARHGAVTWRCGLDLSPDLMHDLIKPGNART
jgi:hypothetical protein